MKLFVTAGEPSGDRLGAGLIDGLRGLGALGDVAGVGGPMMAAAGLESLFPMSELSVMGLVEVLPRYRQLKRRIRETAEAAIAANPDVVVTVDSPDFSFRVAAEIRRRSSVRIVHYVAPTVWAWRPGRARKVAQLVDQILALFPFEPAYFEQVGLRCDFVGHPVTAVQPPTDLELAALRSDLAGASPVIAVLPGSREGEVRRLAPIFGAALRLTGAVHRNMRVVVPVLPGLEGLVAPLIQDWPSEPIIVTRQEARHAAMHVADVALAKSGTVSLELAAAATPMVIAYDVNWLTRALLRRMIRIDTVTLVNLVSEMRAVPELLGRACRPELIAPALLDVIADPARQRAALELTMERLGRGGKPPGLRAAEAVLDGLSG